MYDDDESEGENHQGKLELKNGQGGRSKSHKGSADQRTSKRTNEHSSGPRLSSGYGHVSPLSYSSPGQRRFSINQGIVTPLEDTRVHISERMSLKVAKDVTKEKDEEVEAANGAAAANGEENGEESSSKRHDVAMNQKSKEQMKRTRDRRRQTRKNLKLPVNVVKKKLKAAAYDRGGLNFVKLFKHYDRDNRWETTILISKAACLFFVTVFFS